ncbi:MAG: hypothetical protein J6J18_09505 [Oscillospiraceae bacterium]|nr:hypothetical protein [Oscillospiraceae bacterium]
MQYEKYVEIVHETEDAYIATIWTGPNYYIGWFPKADLDAYVKYAEECGHYVSLEEAIRRTSVGDMHFMCKTEDYDQDTLDAWIAQLLNPDAPPSEVQKEVT